MKEWVLNLLLLLIASVVIVIVLYATGICIWGCPPGDEQVDEENPPCLDQPREAGASRRDRFGVAYLLLLSPLLLLL